MWNIVDRTALLFKGPPCGTICRIHLLRLRLIYLLARYRIINNEYRVPSTPTAQIFANVHHVRVRSPNHPDNFINLMSTFLSKDSSLIKIFMDTDPLGSFCVKLLTDRQTDSRTDRETQGQTSRQTDTG